MFGSARLDASQYRDRISSSKADFIDKIQLSLLFAHDAFGGAILGADGINSNFHCEEELSPVTDCLNMVRLHRSYQRRGECNKSWCAKLSTMRDVSESLEGL